MPLLSLKSVYKSFPIEEGIFRIKSGEVRAIDNISIDLEEGKVLGIVGESGSGKTTLGKAICRLTSIDSGSINIDGKELCSYSRRELSGKVQMIFQDPFASLNPKLAIGTMLFEALDTDNKSKGTAIVSETLETVGLDKSILSSYPHQFSGGQRQRIAIARALIKKPKLIIADEPLSSLDISIQNQLLNIFLKLKNSHSISFVFISHDIVVTSNLADHVIVMKNGKVVEENNIQELIKNPKQEYTKNLVYSAV
jgi:ABC-type microcin C transport system duplicated ATPase subunit YejF